MPAANPYPVIANVWRVAIELASSSAPTVSNILNVFSTAGDATELGDTWEGAVPSVNPWSYVANIYSAPSLSITPLDGVRSASAHSFAQGAGTQAGQVIPEAACCIGIQTGVRGPQARGRIYLGPLTETSADGNNVASGTLTGLVTAMDDMIDALAAASPAILLGVASYKHAVWRQLTSFRVDSFMCTQVRRLRSTR